MDAISILARIEEADLTPVEYRTVRRLLDRTSNHWTVYLSRDDACTLCGVTTWGAASRILRSLQDAGLIALHTNSCAYVRFLDRAETDLQRADPAREGADSDAEPRQNGSPARQNGANRAETDLHRAVSARSLRDWDQGREGSDLSLPLPAVSERGAGGNPHPEPKRRAAAPNRIDPADQVRSVGLLTDPDVGLSEPHAVRVAQSYPFDQVRAQVFRFVRDREAGHARSPGCIPQRLAQPGRFPASVVESDRASPLWQRHHTDEETEALEHDERRRRYDPACWGEEIR